MISHVGNMTNKKLINTEKWERKPAQRGIVHNLTLIFTKINLNLKKKKVVNLLHDCFHIKIAKKAF